MNFTYKWTFRIMEAAQWALSEIKNLTGTQEASQLLDEGAGGDITTFIDEKAEAAIFEKLESFSSPYIMISEEFGTYYYDPYSQKRMENYQDYFDTCKDFIIVDPIDGSTNAVRGLPLSSISIAFADGPQIKDIISGCIIHIATGDIYAAEKGAGAFLNKKPIKCAKTSEIDKSVAIIAFTKPFEKSLKTIGLEFLKDVGKTRIIGSCALNCAFVARAAVDVYIEFRGSIRTIDFAAGYILIKEAGGFFTDETLNNIETGTIFLDGKFSFVCGGPYLQNKMKKYYGNNER